MYVKHATFHCYSANRPISIGQLDDRPDIACHQYFIIFCERVTMVLVEKFCFWFPVRLGVIIVGIVSLIQCCIWLMISMICLDNKDTVKEALKNLIKNLSIHNKFFNDMASDPQVHLIAMAIFFSLMLISCIILIIGAFQCNYRLLFPFLVIDTIYIIFLFVQHVFFMLNFKEQQLGLGQLICYSNLGGFILLYLLYMWVCVLSFVQILLELKRQNLRKSPSDKEEGLEHP